MARILAFVFLWLNIASMFGQTPFTAGLSEEDREIVIAALKASNYNTALPLIDSTAPVCNRDIKPLCVRGDLLFSNESMARWGVTDSADLRDRFITRNANATNLGFIGLDFARISRARIEKMFDGRYGWPELRRTYPGVRTLFQVTAPAYSADRSRALVYVESLCDGRCGGGTLLLFEYVSGRWTFSRCLTGWIG